MVILQFLLISWDQHHVTSPHRLHEVAVALGDQAQELGAHAATLLGRRLAWLTVEPFLNRLKELNGKQIGG